LPGYESSNWFGVVGPANIAAEIVEQLNREINAGLADLKIVDRIAGSHQPFGLFELGDAGALWHANHLLVFAADIRPLSRHFMTLSSTGLTLA
jgi:hypothetical protein